MYEGQFYQTNSLFQKPTPKARTHSIISLILLLCGDIELNPEPGNAPICPCGCCERIVNWSQKAVCYDDCPILYHKTCISMCSIDYESIESTSWRCFKCDSVIWDSLTYHSCDLPVSNRIYHFDLKSTFHHISLHSLGSCTEKFQLLQISAIIAFNFTSPVA